MRQLLYVLSVVLVSTLPAQGQTALRKPATSPVQVLSTLSGASAGITTLQTDFVQYRHVDLLANDIQSKGKLVYARPDRVRWEYTAPYSYIIVVDKNKISLRNNAKTSTINAGSNEFFKQLSGIIRGLIQGDLLSSKEFTCTLYEEGAVWVAALVPVSKEMQAYLARVELSFPKQTNMVSEVKMLEPSGDFTRIVFKNQRYNEPVPATSFVLK